VVEKDNSHGSQEAATKSILVGFLFFPPFILSGPIYYGIVPPTFRANLPGLVNPLWKCSYIYSPRCALLIF
jgi:hypothetical protein